jgi:NADH-quinone oxidoreductase subunit L
VAVIGVLTALLAASIALVQFDLKKILAYSTISQLGLMFLGEGANGYHAGYYHVFTHAFFKACLFLGAGAVMHALANNIDVRKMGNLKRYMPATRTTYLIAVIAIAGIPPLAGFWCKDEIIAATFARGGGYTVLGIGALLVSYLTALYMFRSYYLAFEGEERVDWGALREAARHEHGEDHGRQPAAGPLTDEQKRHLIHETPLMTFVLWALAVGSVVAGIFGVSGLFPGALANLSFERWLEPSLSSWWNRGAEMTPHTLVQTGHVSHLLVAAVSTLVAAAGWYTAHALHRRRALEKSSLPEPLWTLLWQKYRVDDAYSAVFVNGGGRVADRLWQDVDLGVVDTAVNGSGVVVQRIGDVLRRWNNGFVRSYAFSILLGAALVVVYVVYHVTAAKGAS